jgi:adenylosuccinate lyase
MLRERAYKLVQTHAMRAWEGGGSFRAAVESDKEVLSFLTIEKIRAAFSVDRQLTQVDRIFRQVFRQGAQN